MVNSLASGTSLIDKSAADPQKLSVGQLEKFLEEIRLQPKWRNQADLEAKYYDNLQWSADEIQEMTDRGQPVLITNLIAPTINLILGTEAKNRTDFVIRSERQIKEDIQTAEALSVEMKEMERMSRADRACADAYAAQVKVGIGWVEVTKNPDPFKYPFMTNYIHRSEIHWDWRAKHPLLDDARFLLRKRWIDEDAAVLIFPKYKDLIKHSMTGWRSLEHEIESADENLLNEYGRRLESNIEDLDWIDSDRRRVNVYELWYRIWHRGLILRTRNGEVHEFNENNEGHRIAVAGGIGELEEAIYPKTRLSFWLGPHRVVDIPTPLNSYRFPYVPFIGYREDKTNVPYGMIRLMKSPQDEVNARKAKLMFLLAAKRTIVDSDAVDDIDSLRDEVSRPDAMIITNPDRTNREGIQIETELGLSAQQFEVMKSAEQSVQDVAGVYNSMLGQESTARSGIAVNSLIEQGYTTMGELNDNYKLSRTRVGELMLDLLVSSLNGKEKEIKISKPGASSKKIVLNRAFIDENGSIKISNDTTKMRTKVVLDDVPQTPTHRAQQFNYLMEITKSLPEDIQRLIAPAMIEFSDMPGRTEIAKQVKQMMGQSVDPDDLTPEEQQQMQKDQEKQARLDQIEEGMLQADLDEKRAKIRNLESDSVNKSAEAAIKIVDKPEAAPMTDDIMERTE